MLGQDRFNIGIYNRRIRSNAEILLPNQPHELKPYERDNRIRTNVLQFLRISRLPVLTPAMIQQMVYSDPLTRKIPHYDLQALSLQLYETNNVKLYKTNRKGLAGHPIIFVASEEKQEERKAEIAKKVAEELAQNESYKKIREEISQLELEFDIVLYFLNNAGNRILSEPLSLDKWKPYVGKNEFKNRGDRFTIFQTRIFTPINRLVYKNSDRTGMYYQYNEVAAREYFDSDPNQRDIHSQLTALRQNLNSMAEAEINKYG